MSIQVRAMKYHNPSWEADVETLSYMVWAPRERIDRGNGFISPERPGWSACWCDDEDENAGDFVRGETLEQVLLIFPRPVENAFLRVIKDEGFHS